MPPYLDLSFLREPRVRRTILLAAFAGAALGAAYALLAPKWYQSVLTVVPAKPPASGGIAALMGVELGGLASSVAGVGGGAADAARISAVLQSTAVTDEVIARFDLKGRYKERTQEGARDAVWKHCEVKVLPKPNLVQLWCEDRDPAFVQGMVSYFAEIGNKVFARVNVGSAGEEVRYLERRVSALRLEAEEAATQVRQFQEKHHIVDLDSQAKAVVASVTGLQAQRLSKQLELDYVRNFSAPDEAGARQLESQLLVLDQGMRNLEGAQPGPDKRGGDAGREAGRGMFPAALTVPKLRAEYERLYRDRKVAEASLVFALDRLEGARASEARDVSTFQVLDPPTVPTRKSRPRGSETTILGLLTGGGVALIVQWWISRRRGPGSGPAATAAP